MSLSKLAACKQAQPGLLCFQPGLAPDTFYGTKDKVVFVMGATGTGKSRLAIDLATQFPAEIINSDKIQVHRGLEVLTNKVTEAECRGVPHHLLGVIEPDSDFTADDFCSHVLMAIESILGRGRLPIIAGGSNSFIDALVNGNPEFQSRYECCFLWVDVSMPVLQSFVSERVDKMVELGLVGEVRNIYDPKADNSRGIRRAIGVTEMVEYLSIEASTTLDVETKARVLKMAIDEIKKNTCALASRQLQKIHRLNDIWDRKMQRLDATEVFVKRGAEANEVWEMVVAGPSTMIVYGFLYDKNPIARAITPDTSSAGAIATAAVSIPMAAMTH
ncbi:adenylate isopentenyltransferase 5, chloroplastic-like [Punica granatum]|uniref:adenylate dimethylallyltransferase (ADP/ATP-dependent) n=2 Tax=Punica granatum TaxID=22663 RepID=A0A218WNY1_PUNGR|nr:adenylate isopentenyltransferase 5, chloroplastic-like [Punica granatum]OWM74199.1 hypothetical protein CDL15_Pgr008512 [Punica granatum]PKI78518.1 hypothetical protein CRG98_001076 [Punica granatum]